MRWSVVAASGLMLVGLAGSPAMGVPTKKPQPADPVLSCLADKPAKWCTSQPLYDLPLDNVGTGNTVYSDSATAPPAGNPPSYNELAAGFQVPTTGGALLDEVELLVFNWGEPALVSLSLVGSELAYDGYTTSELGPDSDAVLERWTALVPTTPWAPDATFATIRVRSQSRPLLQPGALYWIVLATEQPGASVAWVSHPVWVPNPGESTSAWRAERNSTWAEFYWLAFGPEVDTGRKMRVTSTIWSKPGKGSRP